MELKDLEELSKRINKTLQEVQGSDDSGVDVRSIQKRSIMILQQFYKLLLSDFPPTQWKEIRAYLRSIGFPPLRDTLRIKPSKLPEKLKKNLERYDGPEERKRQLQAILLRLEDAVKDLDDAIFASSKLSKKAERALERLESINGSLEEAILLMRKGEVLKADEQRALVRLPVPDGDLDIEKEAKERHKSDMESCQEELNTLESELSDSENMLNTTMERFKSFLAGSGRHLNLLVTLLPIIREITAPYVKFDSDELTDWEVSVAIKNFGKFRSRLTEGHPLYRDEDEVLDALEHLMNNKEAIADYNAIRHLQLRVQEINESVERKKGELTRVSGEAAFQSIRRDVVRKGEENRHEYERIMNQIEGGDEELKEVMEGLDITVDGDIASLKSEVEELLSLLQ